MEKEKYKRYLIFGYDEFYPVGGLGDILESVDDLTVALLFIDQSPYNYEFYEIFDCLSGQQVTYD